jgi:hypothetical protein
MMRNILLSSNMAMLLLAGCAGVHGEPTTRRNCSAVSFPSDRFISASFTDKFNGHYFNGRHNLTVWREDQRLFIGAPGGSRVQLQRSSGAGEGSFRDGCGTSYRFVLPPDGPGGYLIVSEPNGARSEWHRRLN